MPPVRNSQHIQVQKAVKMAGGKLDAGCAEGRKTSQENKVVNLGDRV